MAKGRLGVMALCACLGCGRDERVAREYLEHEGLEDIALEPMNDEGTFRYSARFGTTLCDGRVSVTKNRRSTHVNDQIICRPNDDNCITGRNPVACFRLGLIHDGDPDPLSRLVHDRARAAVFFNIACEEGDARACNALGLKYFEGDGVARDQARAVALFDKSCVLDHPRGCFNLALSYESGKGIKVDGARAAALYERACEHKLGPACYNQGVCLRDGTCTPRDLIRAANRFDRACSAGHLQGCVNLGVMHVAGEGVASDPLRARALFERACTGGLDTGCQGLARLDG